MTTLQEQWAGTERFEIKRRLGRGGMGVVYEAYDREREMRVALKTLRHVDAQALARFKREFRALHDLEHPNLISLGELIVEAGEWFFTMELVDGTDILAHVRSDDNRSSSGQPGTPALGLQEREFRSAEPSGTEVTAVPGTLASVTTFDEPRLRSALKQLAQGIAALHRSDTLHRDIKPTNILVTTGGHLVLVDFGLVTSMAADRQSSTSSVVGTVEYMAPEQALARDVGPAADWYGMGVVLYEALTGQLPYSGKTAFDLLMKKQQRVALPPSRLVSDVPEDLNGLCCELLQIEPGRRPESPEILERLGADSALAPQSAQTSRSLPTTSSKSSSSLALFTQSTPFVGRRHELALLSRAYEDSREGAAVSVFVHGESGLGKSELVSEFTRGLVAEDPRVLVLSGRCYERESVPYKAFDGIADALSRHMMKLSDAEARQLLPRRAGLLPSLFPALLQVRVIAEARKQSQALLDPQERRTRLFHAFRELLARLADRRPVVLVIDDFQWAGADSLTMLGEVMPAAEAPELLLLGTARPGVEELLSKHSSGEVRHLHLAELPTDDGRELVRIFAPRLEQQQADAIAEDAGGHPLFILELVRHLTSGGGVGAMRLDDALWSRIKSLSAQPRRLVEVLAVAGAPLAQETAAAASALSYGDYEKAVRVLRVGSLARTRSRGSDSVETYHDRVREAVLARLDPAVRKKHHRELAIALERSGAATTDPQVLVRHFAAAGEATLAAEHAEAAALRASATSAFDQAAELYRTVLELGIHGQNKARALRLSLGEALIGAGRGPEAAEVFLEAAEGADSATRLECLRRSAEQLLISGHLERGLEAMRSLLGELGVKMPSTPRGALLSLLWQRTKLRFRGLRWREKDASQISAEALTRLDIYRSVGHGLGIIDVIRGQDFQSRGLLLALRTGERWRVARAVFNEAVFLSTAGPKRAARSRALLEEASRIAAPLQDPYLQAWDVGGDGCLQYFNGQYRTAVSQHTLAEKLYREHGSAGWEMSTVRMFRMWALHRLGALAEMAPHLRDYLRDAERRGDLYSQTSLIRSCHRVLFVSGSVRDARDALAGTSWVSSRRHYHVQHWFEFDALAELALYAGDAHEMADEIQRNVQGIRSSMLLRVQSIRMDFCWLTGRLLMAACSSRGAKGSDLKKVARLARKLERENIGVAKVMAYFLRAGVAVQKQDLELARSLLLKLIDAAEQQDMILHAGVAEYRLGELLGGDEGAALLLRAAQRMKSQGVDDPAPMAQMLAPGFNLEPNSIALLETSGASSI